MSHATGGGNGRDESGDGCDDGLHEAVLQPFRDLHGSFLLQVRD